MQKVLIIQTAFIGDVILATGIMESIHKKFPNAHIDILLRKGNESLFSSHPFVHKVWIWDKKKEKYKGLWRLMKLVKATQYDHVINLQRFFSSGLFSLGCGATNLALFDKNPVSFLFKNKAKHSIDEGLHECQRNHRLLQLFGAFEYSNPKLYPTLEDFEAVEKYQRKPYVCLAPNSVWFTKQLPTQKWIDLIKALPHDIQIFLLGAKNDFDSCTNIANSSESKNVEVLAGQLSFLQSAALMQKASMNFVNDSAPMHLASAVNAPVTAIFCSTIPSFGFGPLSDISKIVEVEENLSCRPCGLHGYKECPKKHFNCGNLISVQKLLQSI